jgi:hypothetical protein
MREPEERIPETKGLQLLPRRLRQEELRLRFRQEILEGLLPQTPMLSLVLPPRLGLELQLQLPLPATRPKETPI